MSNKEHNIGYDSLRESTKNQPPGTYKPEQLRQSQTQHDYRENSKSQNKDKQDVSHGLGLDRACNIIGHEGGIDVSNKENLKGLKSFENSPSNYQMKDSHTNRSTDKKLDHKIDNKIEKGEKLNQTEEQREKRIASNIQAHQDTLTPEVYDKLRGHYEKAETETGHKIWDHRKDTKKMTEAQEPQDDEGLGGVAGIGLGEQETEVIPDEVAGKVEAENEEGTVNALDGIEGETENEDNVLGVGEAEQIQDDAEDEDEALAEGGAVGILGEDGEEEILA